MVVMTGIVMPDVPILTRGCATGPSTSERRMWKRWRVSSPPSKIPQFAAAPTDVLRSRADRRDDARSRRQRSPRSAHAEHPVRPDRPDPLALLAEQHVTRLQDLIPIRLGRMAESPFAFLRGAALAMADDLAHTPTSGLTVQACADAHLLNFGGFASPERREVFDLNDFDETLVGPWEWDVKRLTASASVAADHLGFGPQVAREAARTAAAAYRDAMSATAEMSVLEAWYRQIEFERTLLAAAPDHAQRAVNKAIAKMRRRTSEQLLPRLTRLTDDGLRIAEQPPLVTHAGLTHLEADAAATFFERYLDTLPEERRVLIERFRLIDVARKVVGVGSVGTRCLVALLMAPDHEPLFLQIKEAPPSVFERSCGAYAGSGGRRVVTGQREIQTAADVFLGWADHESFDFYVRQLRDMKFSFDVTTMRPDTFLTYLRLCGGVLARAHGRTGDPVAIAGYLGSGDVFIDAVTEWSMAYAEQTRADHARLVDAIAAGEVEAQVEGEVEAQVEN